jgi:hypothetical protein
LRSQPIDVSLAQLHLPGFSIRSVSQLDPSGWVRVGLEPNPDGPNLAQPAPASNSQPVADAQPAIVTEAGVVAPTPASGQP